MLTHGVSILLLSLLSIIPQDTIIRESVDLVELNHFYDEHGRLVFDQVIFYDWKEHTPKFNVNFLATNNVANYEDRGPRFYPRAWRLVKNQTQIPMKDWKTNTYNSMWMDGELTRCIYASDIMETWSQDDPELYEREIMPKEARKELINPKVKRK